MSYFDDETTTKFNKNYTSTSSNGNKFENHGNRSLLDNETIGHSSLAAQIPFTINSQQKPLLELYVKVDFVVFFFI